jgi:hypothetical protein
LQVIAGSLSSAGFRTTFGAYITDEALFGTTVPGVQDRLAPINGGRAVQVVDTYVVAFVETFLKQQASSLMMGNASRYPEVAFTAVKTLSATSAGNVTAEDVKGAIAYNRSGVTANDADALSGRSATAHLQPSRLHRRRVN